MSERKALGERSIALKIDWDVPVNLPLPGEKNRGHFAGRKRELDSLTNEIERRENGAILIAGHRGVGKTSLVHKAVAQAKVNDSKIIAVLVNAAQMDMPAHPSTGPGSKSVEPRMFVEHLIRRFYATVRSINNDPSAQTPDKALADGTPKDGNAVPLKVPEGVYAKIEALYRKAVAQEFHLRESLNLTGKASDERAREELLEQSVKVELLIYASIAILLSVIAFSIPPRFDWVSNLLPLGVAFGGYAGTATIRSFWKRNTTVSVSKTADELYQFDNKLGNLEFDLEAVQRELRNGDWKIVYVIDELDKLGDAKTKDILAVCKNFFTLSDAIFVFVGDENTYAIGRENSGVLYERPKEYTYFGSRYYLAPPTTADLRQFLGGIVAERTLSDSEFEALGYCLCFEAFNDYFDLLSAIRGRITGFRDGMPVIELEAGGLAPRDIQKARFEICITSLYEGRYMSKSPLRWRENAILLRVLFSKAKDLVEDTSRRAISEPQDQPHHQNQGTRPNPENALIRDFYRLLLRLGAFATASPQTFMRDSTSKYEYTGSIPFDPPLKLDARTEFEEKFLELADQFMRRVVSVYNVWSNAFGKPLLTVDRFKADLQPVMTEFRKWNWNPASTIGSIAPLLDQLKGEPPYEKTKDEIVSAAGNVENELRSIYPQLPLIFASMVLHACVSKPQLMAQFRGEAFLLKGADAMRQALSNDRPQVLYSDKCPQQIILLCGGVEKLTSLIKSQSIPKNVKVVSFVDYPFRNDFKDNLWLVRWDDEQKFVENGSTVLLKAIAFLESESSVQQAAES